MENILGDSTSGIGVASNSAERPAPNPRAQHGFSLWLPVLREIKLRIEQATEGKTQRISPQDQPSIILSFRRWAVRLLMSAASLSPANFAPHTGFFGPSESTPYYPTGDLEGDRSAAFSTAMDRIDELEAHLQGDDANVIATKLFELAQALHDLGLRDYALNTSGFALEALERLYSAAPNSSRIRVASILSLRSNILCDLKKDDEANSEAERAVALCREHKDPQSVPVPELAHALLNHAVILDSIGLQEESAAVAFELLNELDDSQPDMKEVSALCRLCLSSTRVGADNDMASSMAEEAIELTASLSDAISQTVLAGALLAKSKVLASREQNDAASAVSAEAMTLLRSMSAARPVFSLFLAHALDTHAHHLSEANRKGESYAIRQDAVELWQMLKATAGGAVARSLAWSLFELAKFRRKGDRNALREELRLAENAVEVFRDIEILDAPGLGDALYLYADRMLELDKNQEAVTYAEESVIYFQEATDKDPKYALDLIFSLSLASACLACTERDDYAFEYAKRAVEVQRRRSGVGDKQYDAHFRKLLMDVVFRATEMDKQDEAAPWFQELQSLGGLGGMHPFSLFDR
jgi:tetratricopeptide (TPR) repeat protein